MSDATVPTVFEWAGGEEAFTRLTTIFYQYVQADPLLAPLFAQMSPDHPQHVALWLSEVFGGSRRYSDELGGYPHMMMKHLNKHLTEEQRVRFASLLAASADPAGLPSDPEFRSAFIAYIEWGSRIALANSQPNAQPSQAAPVPRWGWGEAPPLVDMSEPASS